MAITSSIKCAVSIAALGLTLAACTDASIIGPGLPTAYPLLPGDAELWQGMNLEQRERALLFLQDGSTIASSLEPD